MCLLSFQEVICYFQIWGLLPLIPFFFFFFRFCFWLICGCGGGDSVYFVRHGRVAVQPCSLANGLHSDLFLMSSLCLTLFLRRSAPSTWQWRTALSLPRALAGMRSQSLRMAEVRGSVCALLCNLTERAVTIVQSRRRTARSCTCTTAWKWCCKAF